MNSLKWMEEFDKKIIEQEEFNIVLGKFLRYIIEFICFLLATIPIQELYQEGFFHRSVMFSGMFLFLCPYFYLQPYIQIREQGKVVSIYKKLKYMPISSKDIFLSRWKYLMRYARKMGSVLLVCQLIGAFVSYKEISIWNIIYPIFVTGITVVFSGFFVIYKKK